MRQLYLLFILFSFFLFSFDDLELMQLWDSIEEITNPTIADYQKIEAYLHQGERKYLNPLAAHNRYPLIKNLKLLGPHGEMPIFEKHSFHVDGKSKTRCIVLFSSYNGIYPEKARTLLSELRKCGYRGHLLFHIGGFPNIANGGLKICHVPYAFKVAALLEARNLGFKEILWLDTALHPLTNLENIFSMIKKKGFFFTTVGPLSANKETHLPEAAAALGITPDHYPQIPHLSSSMIGLNMKHQKAAQLLDHWLAAAEHGDPFITCWPEELSLSVIAWRLGCQPYGWFGNTVCGEHELHMPLVRMRPLEFYIDARR